MTDAIFLFCSIYCLEIISKYNVYWLYICYLYFILVLELVVNEAYNAWIKLFNCKLNIFFNCEIYEQKLTINVYRRLGNYTYC